MSGLTRVHSVATELVTDTSNDGPSLLDGARPSRNGVSGNGDVTVV